MRDAVRGAVVARAAGRSDEEAVVVQQVPVDAETRGVHDARHLAVVDVRVRRRLSTEHVRVFVRQPARAQLTGILADCSVDVVVRNAVRCAVVPRRTPGPRQVALLADSQTRVPVDPHAPRVRHARLLARFDCCIRRSEPVKQVRVFEKLPRRYALLVGATVARQIVMRNSYGSAVESRSTPRPSQPALPVGVVRVPVEADAG